jgi:hypothetical protein
MKHFAAFISEPTTGGGSTNDELFGRVNFTYASSSPFTVLNLQANDEIDQIKVVITTPFDDATSRIDVGTVATPKLVFDALRPTKLKQQTDFNHHLISVAEILRLLITPGTSTQGAGYIVYRIRRP